MKKKIKDNIIDISIEDLRSKSYVNKLLEYANAILEYLNVENSCLEIVIVSQNVMKKINNKLRKINEPTNVLSFQVDKEFKNIMNFFLGEVFICPAYVNKNSQNLKFILLHGILHLFDFDHESLHDRIKMEKKEKEIMSNVFGETSYI